MENPDPLENRPSASTTSGTQTRRTGHPEECVVFRNALKMSLHYKLWIHVSCAIRG